MISMIALRNPGPRAKRIRTLLAVGTLVSWVALADAAAVPLQPVAHSQAVPGPPGSDDRTGALFHGGVDGDHWCTASVVHSPGRDLIVTAGHCLAGDGDSDAEDAVFVPGYDGTAGDEAPHGEWRVEHVYADEPWTEDADEDHDVAFATVAPNEDGERIEDVVGAAALDASGRTDERVTVAGYPSDADEALRCTVRATRFSATQQRTECDDFSGGTSGSPWLAADGKLVGVLGGYQGGGEDPDVSYSVILGRAAERLYQEAVRGSSDA